MALTQDQVNYWFAQNPNATADDVAKAVQGAGGLDANAGLADMIANRYNIGSNQVTDYYNQYAAPTGGALAQATNQNVNTEANNQVAGNLSTTVANTTTNQNLPSIIYGTTGTDGDVLTRTTTSDGTPFYLRGEEGGEYQNPNTVESYVPFTGTDGKTYYNVYAPVFSTGKAFNETPITGTLTEAQYNALRGGSSAIGNLINSPVGSFALNLLGPAGQIINAANQANNGNYLGAAVSGLGAASGLGVTDIGGIDIKTATNVARGLNAIDKKDLAGAFTAGANLIGGTPSEYTTASNLASAGLALKNNDTAGFITALGDLTGSQDAKVAAAALRLKDVMSADTFNPTAFQNAFSGFNSAISGSKTTTASTKTSSLSDIGANAYAQAKAAGASDDEALAAANLASGDTTLPSGVQLASLGDTVFKTDIGGVPIYAESKVASSITPPFGYSLLSVNEADEKPEGSYYDATTNAWFKPDTAVTNLGDSADIQSDIDLFKSSQGDLDSIAASTASTSDDQVADFLKSIGITNTTQLADSGLSNQDILDQINASKTTSDNVDELVVTGDKDKVTDGDDTPELVIIGDKNKTTDTTVDTITGGNGNDVVDDKGTVVITDKKDTCPIGTRLNPETGECDPIEDTPLTCPAGFHLSEDGKSCVPDDKETPLTCPTGFHLSADGKSCEPDEEKPLTCPTGFHLSADGKSCVPDDTKKPLECPEGFELNDEGTACIPVLVIEDKKCAEGYVYDEELKQCVPITKKPDECGVGYHWDEASQSCVKDTKKDECGVGYHWDEASQSCVKDTEVKPPVVTPPKKTTKTSTFTAGAPATGGSGKPIDFLKEQLLKTYMTKQSFKDPLAEVRKAQQELMKENIMQQGVDPRLAAILAARATGSEPEAMPTYSYGKEPDNIDDILGLRDSANQAYKAGGYVQPLMAQGGMALPLLAAKGGLPTMHKGREDFRDGKHVAGEGDGQSDDIPAMLADGEFVFPADVVSALGNGSTKAGTDKLYEMMHSIRDRARSKGPKDLPPPALKSPLDYLKKR